MRATRETELLQSFPIHEVANWLGHCPTVAMKQYTQVSKEQTVFAYGNDRSKSQSMLGRRTDKQAANVQWAVLDGPLFWPPLGYD